MIRLLVVDDSALMRRLLAQLCAGETDLELAFARDGIEALARLHEFQPNVVTLDIHMPGLDGLGCLDRIMLERPTPVIMVSALTEAGADITLDAMQLGAVDFIAKPAGAISLVIEDWAPLLLEKVRAAAGMRLRQSLRLAERLRLKAGAQASVAARPSRLEQARIPAREPPQNQPSANTIVLVGASTGGPPALDALLAPLPADFPWPILIAQHMPASFTGPLSRRLDRLCALQVIEVTQAMAVAPGTVYVARGDADVVVGLRAGQTVVMPAPSLANYVWHPSVDRLVTTAMQHIAAPDLIGILMTGMGNDGAAAMARLRETGGRTIAEAEETAVVWGMPGELVKAGGASVVARLERIAAQLLEWTA